MILIVKSTLALLPGAVLLAGALSGCGQTGDLYMPTPPSRPAPAPVEQPPQPVPSNNASTPAPNR
ncbi:LPS translocon maturation chaperone LptM [Telluria beijingensis]|uniref:LPS translocon maturation chaperone LptM n=1 Tax=Telluria beijingensis TaxID=3068633 RepID=UPI002795756F|nr:lipoprotein [Massilia sp. REN29]